MLMNPLVDWDARARYKHAAVNSQACSLGHSFEKNFRTRDKHLFVPSPHGGEDLINDDDDSHEDEE
eukprot:2762557-Rhodomonas_salina.4